MAPEYPVSFAFIAIAMAVISAPAHSQQACSTAAAVFVSVEGNVELSRSGTQTWSPVNAGDALCAGDSVRTGDFARAGLRLPNGTDARMGSNGAARWNPPREAEEGPWLLDVLRGLIHIISREPRSLDVTTPFANAGIEGTEFVVEVTDDSTSITVIEGAVLMDSGNGPVEVGARERGVAGGDAATAVARADDYLAALDWARYSPIGLNLPSIAPDEVPPADRAGDASFYANRAAQRWRRGASAEAESDLAQALALDPRNSQALAVQALIAVTLREGTMSDEDAMQTAAAIPDRALADFTGAIVQMNRSQWDEARATLEIAGRNSPDSAAVWAHLAEALLATNELPGALAAAQRALTLDPGNVLAQTMLGFASLAELDHAGAAAAFERAVLLDDAAPLPHFGLGLAHTRAGNRDAGREEFETAVLLSPDDALLRSYAAKAYFDQRDLTHATSQVELAKELDMSEPTPWLYGTLVKQSTNSPVDALRDLDRANALNGDLSVYRSGMLFEQDQAVRNAPLGRLYSDMGFERLALAAGTESIQFDTRDHSGHRLRADSYSALPRHQIARANELFVSQLLQPENTTAIPPQLAEPNMFILDTVGPAALSFNEFNPLLVSNHATVQGAATVGGNDTHGEHLTVSGIRDRFSYSIGGFGFESDGFRENNDVDMDVTNAFAQFRPNSLMSLIGEVRSSDMEGGDLRLMFHDDNYYPVFRQGQSFDTVMLGMHRRLGANGDFLAAAHHRDGAFDFSFGPGSSVAGSSDIRYLDLQHLLRSNRWQLTTGANVYSDDLLQTSLATINLPEPPFVVDLASADNIRTEFQSIYAYSDYRISRGVTFTLGASVDQLEGREERRRELNPKLGLAWSPGSRTTVRVAGFSILQGPLASTDDILPRIEPTAVSGFNQFFFGSEGDEVTRYAVGLDRRLSSDLSYGMELSRRDIETGVIIGPEPPAEPYVQRVRTAEDSGRAYVYWAPRSALALSAELQGDIFDNKGLSLGDGYARLETYRMPLQVRYFLSGGLATGFGLTYVDQSGDFGQAPGGSGSIAGALLHDEDQFWVADAHLTYRLPGRRGILKLNVHNLFDEEYNFQDLDPENPRIMPDRFVSLGFTLAL